MKERKATLHRGGRFCATTCAPKRQDLIGDWGKKRKGSHKKVIRSTKLGPSSGKRVRAKTGGNALLPREKNPISGESVLQDREKKVTIQRERRKLVRLSFLRGTLLACAALGRGNQIGGKAKEGCLYRGGARTIKDRDPPIP